MPTGPVPPPAVAPGGCRSRASPPSVVCVLLVTLALGSPSPGLAQPEDAILADRIVAVVDEDPILWSDMQRVMRLGLISRAEEEDQEEYEGRVLREIIDIRLRFHEVDRFGIRELPLSAVDEQYREVRRGFADAASFEAELSELGLTPDQLRGILARQLMVLSFVEERLGPRVFVSLEDIEVYYEETLKPEMERWGEPVPELPEVREDIRAVLREQALNEEIESWTDELRLRADISDYLEREARELPPVVE